MSRAFFWLSVALLTAGSSAAAFVSGRRPIEPEVPVQPIAFSHAVHVQGKPRLACADCHPGAYQRARAGLPSLERCLSCHIKPQSERPQERVVRELAMESQWPQFRPVTANEGHVFFSHRAHVVLVGMPCSRCHGDVAAWSAPPEKPETRLLSMDLCIGCHHAEGASTACTVCHR